MAAEDSDVLEAHGRNSLIRVWSPAGARLDLTLLKVQECLH